MAASPMVVLRRARALLAVAERGLIEAGMRDDAAGALDRAGIERAIGHLEGAAVLGWALDLLALPAHDVAASSWEVTDAFAAASSPALRPAAELLRAAHRLHAIAARLHQTWPVDFVRLSQEQGFDLFGIAIVDRDLAIAGRPVSRADPDHLRIAVAIAAERLRAITWLLQ